MGMTGVTGRPTVAHAGYILLASVSKGTGVLTATQSNFVEHNSNPTQRREAQAWL